MIPAGLNPLAVLLAAIASLGFGALWYMLLARPWLDAVGWSDGERARFVEQGRKPSWSFFLLGSASLLVMAWVLANLIAFIAPGKIPFGTAIFIAFYVWLGFVATTIPPLYIFSMRKPALTLIDCGFVLCALLIQGAIIGLFGR